MKTKRNFVKDNKGIAWILGVAILSIVFLPIVYFPLSYAWDQIDGSITGNYAFTGVTLSSLTVVRLIISWLMGFSVFFTIAWAFTQSKKSRYET